MPEKLLKINQQQQGKETSKTGSSSNSSFLRSDRLLQSDPFPGQTLLQINKNIFADRAYNKTTLIELNRFSFHSFPVFCQSTSSSGKNADIPWKFHSELPAIRYCDLSSMGHDSSCPWQSSTSHHSNGKSSIADLSIYPGFWQLHRRVCGVSLAGHWVAKRQPYQNSWLGRLPSLGFDILHWRYHVQWSCCKRWYITRIFLLDRPLPQAMETTCTMFQLVIKGPA